MKKIELNEDEINSKKLGEILNSMFYEVRFLSKSKGLSKEKNDLLLDCLDGTPNGITGIQLLMAELKGTIYDLVTNPDGKREYVKKAPEDPKIIYHKLNELIDFINSIVDEKSLTPESALENALRSGTTSLEQAETTHQ